jgi:hypothetical protein
MGNFNHQMKITSPFADSFVVFQAAEFHNLEYNIFLQREWKSLFHRIDLFAHIKIWEYIKLNSSKICDASILVNSAGFLIWFRLFSIALWAKHPLLVSQSAAELKGRIPGTCEWNTHVYPRWDLLYTSPDFKWFGFPIRPPCGAQISLTFLYITPTTGDSKQQTCHLSSPTLIQDQNPHAAFPIGGMASL